jgi:hypothetical protein
MACHVGRLVAASTTNLALSLDKGGIFGSSSKIKGNNSSISACMSQHDTRSVACSDTE